MSFERPGPRSGDDQPPNRILKEFILEQHPQLEGRLNTQADVEMALMKMKIEDITGQPPDWNSDAEA